MGRLSDKMEAVKYAQPLVLCLFARLSFIKLYCVFLLAFLATPYIVGKATLVHTSPLCINIHNFVSDSSLMGFFAITAPMTLALKRCSSVW